MKREKIKIGQIGTAHDHAPGILECVVKYPDVFELVGIGEDDEENAMRFKQNRILKDVPVMSVSELLNVSGLKAVTVETAERKLLDFALKAVKNGLHVHIDKPAGADINAFANVLGVAAQKKLAVQLGYMYRYNPAVEYCVSAARSGMLGEIYHVGAIMNSWYPPDKREWTKDFPNGNMFYLGCHMLDLIVMTQGLPQRVVPFCKSTGTDGVTAYDNAFAVCEYKNGVSFAQASLSECIGYNRRQYTVCGSDGVMKIEPLEGKDCMPSRRVLCSFSKRFSGEYEEILLPSAAGRYDSMMLDFAAMARGEKENPFTYEYEYNVQKVVLAACSAEIDLHKNDFNGNLKI